MSVERTREELIEAREEVREVALAEQAREEVKEAKGTSELLQRLRESLARAADKNDSLLEAIESTEARASETGGREVALLRNLRARLAACHTPNSTARRDLATFTAQFERLWRRLEEEVGRWEERHRLLDREQRQLDERQRRYENERKAFEDDRLSWQQELDQARRDILDQNDRLTLLSQQLTGTKEALEERTSELASQRIAFEEERLSRQRAGGEVNVQESEAQQLQQKLKEQVLKNVELERALLCTELSLQQKSEAAQVLESRVARQQAELQQGQLASARAVRQFERRTAEANKKLSQMNAELSKAQEHATRFQDMLATERRRQKGLKHALEQELQKKGAGQGAGLTPVAQRAYVESLSETLSPHSRPTGPTRVDDIIRKHEAILVENREVKAKLRRIQLENSDLLRQVRFSNNNAHYMRNQVVSNIADRAELIRRLDRAEMQYKELEQSLSQQAAGWVEQKRREKTTEKSVRWAQVEPVPVLGASERTWNVPTKPHPQSRSISVHKW